MFFHILAKSSRNQKRLSFERFERHYKLKALGYDLEKISQVVSKIYDIEKEEIYSKGWREVQVEARDLLCPWTVREYGRYIKK